jgi:exodeoxyribonuclease VII large subunit
VALARQQNQSAAQRAQNAAARMARAVAALIAQRKDKLDRLARLQESLSHKSVLARGFALVRDENDALVRFVAQAPDGAALTIEFADGRIFARAGQTPAQEPQEPGLSRRRARKAPGGDQGSLF